MKFTRESTAATMIRSADAGELRIGNDVYTKTIALTTDTVFGEWQDTAIDDLRVDDLETLLATGPELIVLGTGKQGKFAPKELVFALARKGIGLEVMDTIAAARTFNVLASEGRSVAALLYVQKN